MSFSSSTASAYVKKPYLGWRSQERLAASGASTPVGGAPPKLSVYLPPAERLANELIASRQKVGPMKKPDRPPLPKPPPRTHSIANKDNQSSSNNGHVRESIREVTNAINEFVTEQKHDPSISHNQIGAPPKPIPRQKPQNRRNNVWMESSFVGKKPATVNKK